MPKTHIDRREALSLLGAFGAVLLTECSSGTDAGTFDNVPTTDAGVSADAATTDAATTSDASGAATCDARPAEICHRIPAETSGPYPDTTGMIGNAAFNRSNVVEDRTGVPLILELTISDASNSCTPISGAHVEIWHCDKDGIYSEYANSMNAGSTTTTYLRGWQTSDASGLVTFSTIYPGWYSPRATHIHITVYSGTTEIFTTQIGFPDAINASVYALATYKNGQANSATDDTDQVFGGTDTGGSGDNDGGGHTYQIANVCGDVTSGFTAQIPAPSRATPEQCGYVRAWTRVDAERPGAVWPERRVSGVIPFDDPWALSRIRAS